MASASSAAAGGDVVYVIRAWREKHTTPVLHAAALRSWGKRLIWTWPRDGRRETLEGAGISLASTPPLASP
jgi:hypothetical protein